MTEPIINEIDVKSVLTKSNLPICEYSVNPYVGCSHACKYCYASFMKRFTGHTESWGTFLDVKHQKAIKNPGKYKGNELFIGSVTDPYNPQEDMDITLRACVLPALSHRFFPVLQTLKRLSGRQDSNAI